MIATPSDMTPVVNLTHGKGVGPVRYHLASSVQRMVAASETEAIKSIRCSFAPL